MVVENAFRWHTGRWGVLMWMNDGGLDESRNFPLTDMRRNSQ